jgi:cell division protein FtsL
MDKESWLYFLITIAVLTVTLLILSSCAPVFNVKHNEISSPYNKEVPVENRR